jgi:hypothetical protein
MALDRYVDRSVDELSDRERLRSDLKTPSLSFDDLKPTQTIKRVSRGQTEGSL